MCAALRPPRRLAALPTTALLVLGAGLAGVDAGPGLTSSGQLVGAAGSLGAVGGDGALRGDLTTGRAGDTADRSRPSPAPERRSVAAEMWSPVVWADAGDASVDLRTAPPWGQTSWPGRRPAAHPVLVAVAVDPAALDAAAVDLTAAVPQPVAPRSGRSTARAEPPPPGGQEATAPFPAAEPLIVDRPVDDGPVEDPPAEEAPAGDAPVEDPPVGDAPVEGPPPSSSARDQSADNLAASEPTTTADPAAAVQVPALTPPPAPAAPAPPEAAPVVAASPVPIVSAAAEARPATGGEQAGTSTGGASEVPLSAAATDVVRLSDEERAAEGCAALVVDAALTRAAQAHASDMVRRRYFSHTGPEGDGVRERVEAQGHEGSAGENLAAGHDAADGVVAGWMASPGHRVNLLSCDYTRIGVGHDPGTVGDGLVGSWVQVFG